MPIGKRPQLRWFVEVHLICFCPVQWIMIDVSRGHGLVLASPRAEGYFKGFPRVVSLSRISRDRIELEGS
jgi:hypothetical protein